MYVAVSFQDKPVWAPLQLVEYVEEPLGHSVVITLGIRKRKRQGKPRQIFQAAEGNTERYLGRKRGGGGSFMILTALVFATIQVVVDQQDGLRNAATQGGN